MSRFAFPASSSPSTQASELSSERPTILAIGSLPPPAIGPTIAMQRLLEAENLRSAFNLELLDISDRRSPENIGALDFGNVVLAIKHIGQFFAALLRKRPSIVYLNISQGVWGYLRDLGFIVPALLMGKKIVIHLRGSEFGSFYTSMPKPSRWLTRAVFKRVARVVVLGRQLKGIFVGLTDEDSIAVVPNGINYKQFDDRAASSSRRNSHNILHVSGLRRRKGVLELIQALPTVIANCPDVHVTLVGQWQDNNDEKEALNLIRATGIAEHVTFTGEITGSEKVKVFQEHGMFVFTPIEPEGLPWVILEAMSAGLPVITSDQGAIAEVVENGKTGFIIEPRPEVIAEKICYLLSQPQQAQVLGLNGRRRVETYFSEDRYFKAMEQVFKEALKN